MSRYLLTHDKGPLTIAYLAKNPRVMDEIATMPTAEAAVYISENVLPHVDDMKPKTSSAPAPLDVIEGKGKEENSIDSDPLIKGATFS